MLAMVALFWGASNFIQTICLKEITPLTLVMLRFLVASIANRDYPVVQGCVLFIAFVYVIVNLLVDILYTYIDPRITYS